MKWKVKRRWLSSQACYLWTAWLSKTWMALLAGLDELLMAVPRMFLPITLPSSPLRAANRVVVPLRLQSWNHVPSPPFLCAGGAGRG